MSVSREDTHRVLVGGLNRIDRDGWWQGGMGIGPNREACPMLACIGAACALGVSSVPAIRMLAEVATGDPTAAISAWNDQDYRKLSEVRAVFLGAIAKTAPEPPDLQLSELVEAAAVVA
jgi:homospermidine synthase